MRKFLGYVMLILTVCAMGFMNYPIPEAVNPFEAWLMRHGVPDVYAVLIEVVLLVLMGAASFFLLRRRSDYDPRDYSH